MRKILSLLFSTIMLFTLFAPRSAMATEGQLICRSVISGYYAIYSDGSSQWFANNGEPVTLGQAKTVKVSAGAPFDVSNWDITDINVYIPSDSSLSNDMFDKSKVSETKTYIWRDGLTKIRFNSSYLTPTPDGLTVKDTHDLSTGKVDYEYSFYLSPVERAANVRKPDAGYFYDPTWGDIWASKSEAILWTLPVVIEWRGVPKSGPDLMVSDLDTGAPDEAKPNTEYTATVKFLNDYDKPVKGVELAVFAGSSKIMPTTKVDFEPGEEKTFTVNYKTPAEGILTLKAVIDTPPVADQYQEADETNNIMECDVSVGDLAEAPANGRLTFSAVSQDNSITRPANTAKWTDHVTATLSPKKPTPPKGTITSWSVTSATLNYPSKNPKFTFGHPLPPVGTKTITMNPSGHKATVTFDEDWSLNGANIYDIIARKMVDGPTNYTITANYTVRFIYKWTTTTHHNGHSHTVTHTASGTESGTESGTLLVNGTGVNSRGN